MRGNEGGVRMCVRVHAPIPPQVRVLFLYLMHYPEQFTEKQSQLPHTSTPLKLHHQTMRDRGGQHASLLGSVLPRMQLPQQLLLPHRVVFQLGEVQFQVFLDPVHLLHLSKQGDQEEPLSSPRGAMGRGRRARGRANTD